MCRDGKAFIIINFSQFLTTGSSFFCTIGIWQMPANLKFTTVTFLPLVRFTQKLANTIIASWPLQKPGAVQEINLKTTR